MMKPRPLRSIADLCALRRAIEHDPKSAAPSGLHAYTLAARRKLAAIDQEITAVLAEQRAAAGRPVPVAGYAGRQTNRGR